GLEAGRVERAFEEAAAVQRVADGAGAVVPGRFEGAVTPAPDVGRGGDRVRRFDRALDGRGRVGGDARLAFGDVFGALAGAQRRGRRGDRGRGCGGGLDLFGDPRQVVAQRLGARLELFQRRLPRRLGFLQFGEARLGRGLRIGDFLLLD